MTLRTTVVGIRPKMTLRMSSINAGLSLDAALKEERDVYFGGDFIMCGVFDRKRLPGKLSLPGPAVIEQPDATTVIEPDMTCNADSSGNLIIKEAR